MPVTTMTTKKTSSRLIGTNVVQARQRMRGRMASKRGLKDEVSKEKLGNYRLREVKKGGKKQFLLIKKRENCQPAVEEIFTEWKSNLENKKSHPNRQPRVRKMSHRAQRKAQLREAELAASTIPVSNQPLLYSDVLKKNLNLSGITPMEDIFEAWRDYLQELDDLLNEDLSVPTSPEPISMNPIESAVVKIKNSVVEMKRQKEQRARNRLEQVNWVFNSKTFLLYSHWFIYQNCIFLASPT